MCPPPPLATLKPYSDKATVLHVRVRVRLHVGTVDEVDAMLGKRGMSQEHEASLQVKTGVAVCVCVCVCVCACACVCM